MAHDRDCRFPRWLWFALLGLVGPGTARAQALATDTVLDWPFYATLTMLMLALLAVAALAQRNARFHRLARAIEQSARQLSDGAAVTLQDIPALLDRVRAEIGRWRAEPAPPAQPGPSRNAELTVAVELVESALDAAGALPQVPGSAAAHFEMARQLSAVAASLRIARDSTAAADALLNALRTGQLNHLLTTSAVLATYFRSDPALAPVRAQYDGAAGLIVALLARSSVTLDLPPPLSFLPRRQFERQVRFVDVRQLGQFQPIREQVRQHARKIEEGELLIVDCLAPGWRGGGTEQPPTMIAYHRPDWTT